MSLIKTGIALFSVETVLDPFYFVAALPDLRIEVLRILHLSSGKSFNFCISRFPSC